MSNNLRLRLTFKAERPKAGESFEQRPDVVIEADLIGSISLEETRQIWEMEQVFNALTRRRLHLEIIEP